jgi:rod shape-determining protein MreC
MKRRSARLTIIFAMAALAVVAIWSPVLPAGATSWLDPLRVTLVQRTAGAHAWTQGVIGALSNPAELISLRERIVILEAERAFTVTHSAQDEQRETLVELRGSYRSLGALAIADVVGANMSDPRAMLIITLHEQATSRVGDPVIAGGALIGTLVRRQSVRATVRLLSDANAAIGAARAGEVGAIGRVVRDSGGGLILTHVPRDRDIQVGDAIVTAAILPEIPPGLLIGFIADVREQADGFFRVAAIDPAIDPVLISAVDVLTIATE